MTFKLNFSRTLPASDADTVIFIIYITDSSVGRALHWHRRGHEFKSRSGLVVFFQALISQLVKLR